MQFLPFVYTPENEHDIFQIPMFNGKYIDSTAFMVGARLTCSFSGVGKSENL